VTRLTSRAAALVVAAIVGVGCGSADEPSSEAPETNSSDAGEPTGGVVVVHNALDTPLHIYGLDSDEGRADPNFRPNPDEGGYDDYGMVEPGRLLSADLHNDPPPEHCLTYPIVAYDLEGAEVARLEPGICTGDDNYEWVIRDNASASTTEA
jgi:hypothetical protein